MRQLQFHRLADLFPLMEDDAFIALVADIRERGLLHPLTILDDQILDGRNRYRACLQANVAVRVAQYSGDDPLGFVVASNLHRRHLDESQRAMVAAKLATLRSGVRSDRQGAQICAPTQNQAADMLHVARRSVQHAAAVRDRGTPELVRSVERGAIPVSVAAKVATLSADAQRQAVAEPDRAQHLVKRVVREQREQRLAEATLTASRELGTKRYGVIYADPPWRFEPYSVETGSDRAADNHYPTMTVNDIAEIELPVGPSCVLFMWATVPMLELAIKLMHRWTFEYKSACAWYKPQIGTGYWFRNQLELLLVGTHGDVPAPAMGYQPPQVITADRGAHSEKPDAFADMIAAMFPNVPKLEMFARTRRPGWDVWGNQL